MRMRGDDPSLSLWDQDNKSRVILKVLADIGNVPFIGLYDHNEKPSVQMSVLKDNAGIFLHDQDGKPRIDMSIQDNIPLFALTNPPAIRA